jgi:hypothetical protein
MTTHTYESVISPVLSETDYEIASKNGVCFAKTTILPLYLPQFPHNNCTHIWQKTARKPFSATPVPIFSLIMHLSSSFSHTGRVLLHLRRDAAHAAFYLAGNPAGK